MNKIILAILLFFTLITSVLAQGSNIAVDSNTLVESIGQSYAIGGDQQIVFESGKRPVPGSMISAPMVNAPTLWNVPDGARANVHNLIYSNIVSAACAAMPERVGEMLVYPSSHSLDADELVDIDYEFKKTAGTFSPHPNGFVRGAGVDVKVSLASLSGSKPFGERRGRCLGTIVVEGQKGEDTAQFATIKNDAIRYTKRIFKGTDRHLFLVSMPSVFNAAWTTKNSGWTIGLAASTSGYMGDALGSAYTGASVGSGRIGREGRPGGAWVLIEMYPEGSHEGVVIDFANIGKVYDTVGFGKLVKPAASMPVENTVKSTLK